MLLVESKQAWIEHKVGEIAALSAQVDGLNSDWDQEPFEQVGNSISKVFFELIGEIPLGSLDESSIKKLDTSFFKRSDFLHASVFDEQDLWVIYQLLNEYTRANDPKKHALFAHIEAAARSFFANPAHIVNPMRFLHPSLIKQVYLSGDEELVHLFYTILPIPPLSLFDRGREPQLLLERASQRAKALAVFEENSKEDPLQREKVKFIQRSIRSCLWGELARKRIETRHLDQPPMGVIREANTPYWPKITDSELKGLAGRIVHAAFQVKLFDSVSHLCAASNIAPILDDCLYGRENLVHTYNASFRAASLMIQDIRNGDGNAICLGSDDIDPNCKKGRTVGLELDLERLTSTAGAYSKNGALFFKQRDFGYAIKTKQKIEIGKGKTLHFTHAKPLVNRDPLCSNLQLFSCESSQEPLYYSEVKQDLLISNNMESIHQILILNFFRFIDELDDRSGKPAVYKKKEIYEAISKLSDVQLQAFLQELGQKMSCSSEFNIYGAHEIDLEAIRSFTIYNGELPIATFSMQKLSEDLSAGDYTSWNELLGHLPEIAASRRFMSFIQEKVPTFIPNF